MKMEISVTEVHGLINEIRQQPEGSLFDMIRQNVKETVSQYLTSHMKTELTSFLGREEYERCEGEANHRNGFYGRKFTLKGIGEVDVKVPRDRNGDFRTEVISLKKRSSTYITLLRMKLRSSNYLRCSLQQGSESLLKTHRTTGIGVAAAMEGEESVGEAVDAGAG